VHGVRVFLNSGHDNLLCAGAEHLGGCTIRFRKDGGVQKLYEMAGDLAAADIHGRAAWAGISTGSSARRAHIAAPHPLTTTRLGTPHR